MSMNSMFNNMFGKIQNGMCRLSMDGFYCNQDFFWI